MRFATLTDIQNAEFAGLIPVPQLRQSNCQAVPEQPGVYLVLRTAATEPVFLPESVGGHFKGRNPSLPLAVLSKQWVTGSPVIYIGQTAQSLRRRVRRLLSFGLGKPVGHWGGRCIWQLADSDELLIGWKPTPDDHPAAVESRLIDDFKAQYGRRPFANLRD